MPFYRLFMHPSNVVITGWVLFLPDNSFTGRLSALSALSGGAGHGDLFITQLKKLVELFRSLNMPIMSEQVARSFSRQVTDLPIMAAVKEGPQIVLRSIPPPHANTWLVPVGVHPVQPIPLLTSIKIVQGEVIHLPLPYRLRLTPAPQPGPTPAMPPPPPAMPIWGELTEADLLAALQNDGSY